MVTIAGEAQINEDGVGKVAWIKKSGIYFGFFLTYILFLPQWIFTAGMVFSCSINWTSSLMLCITISKMQISYVDVCLAVRSTTWIFSKTLLLITAVHRHFRNKWVNSVTVAKVRAYDSCPVTTLQQKSRTIPLKWQIKVYIYWSKIRLSWCSH